MRDDPFSSETEAQDKAKEICSRAFDESAANDDERWEAFARQVSDILRLARHHPQTLVLPNIQTNVLPHLVAALKEPRTTVAITIIRVKTTSSVTCHLILDSAAVPRCTVRVAGGEAAVPRHRKFTPPKRESLHHHWPLAALLPLDLMQSTFATFTLASSTIPLF